jgi:hypothetical protein
MALEQRKSICRVILSALDCRSSTNDRNVVRSQDWRNLLVTWLATVLSCRALACADVSRTHNTLEGTVDGKSIFSLSRYSNYLSSAKETCHVGPYCSGRNGSTYSLLLLPRSGRPSVVVVCPCHPAVLDQILSRVDSINLCSRASEDPQKMIVRFLLLIG